jgi:hypothetical protein
MMECRTTTPPNVIPLPATPQHVKKGFTTGSSSGIVEVANLHTLSPPEQPNPRGDFE